jgi:hypothetical protein
MEDGAVPAGSPHGVLGVAEELAPNAGPAVTRGDDHPKVSAHIRPPDAGQTDEIVVDEGAEDDGTDIRAGAASRTTASRTTASQTTASQTTASQAGSRTCADGFEQGERVGAEEAPLHQGELDTAAPDDERRRQRSVGDRDPAPADRRPGSRGDLGCGRDAGDSRSRSWTRTRTRTGTKSRSGTGTGRVGGARRGQRR